MFSWSNFKKKIAPKFFVKLNWNPADDVIVPGKLDRVQVACAFNQSKIVSLKNIDCL
jgi:hypothetical protein